MYSSYLLRDGVVVDGTQPAAEAKSVKNAPNEGDIAMYTLISMYCHWAFMVNSCLTWHTHLLPLFVLLSVMFIELIFGMQQMCDNSPTVNRVRMLSLVYTWYWLKFI